MNKIKAFFLGIWHLFSQVEEKAIDDFETKLEQAGPKLIELAVDAAKTAGAAASGDVSSRDAAIAKLKEDAVAEGLDLVHWAKNEFNALMELAYLAAKPAIKASAPATEAKTADPEPAA